MTLEETFHHIDDNHKDAIIKHVAKVCFTGSTGRVFPKAKNKSQKSANEKIKEALTNIAVDELLRIKSQKKFEEWFEEKLENVTKKIPRKMSQQDKKTGKHIKINDDARKWGYGAKILCLFLREIVLHCRYFTPEEAVKVRRWLYCPIDSKIIKRMKKCNDVPKDRFDTVQKLLGDTKAVKKEGIPRIWFDYVWSSTD
ncbi:MAG: hypothetical protein JXM79_15190 [Sedimentisphaerales bacterium]|nr:hypothetical protein [Sedimentisphaerales bacterium]